MLSYQIAPSNKSNGPGTVYISPTSVPAFLAAFAPIYERVIAEPDGLCILRSADDVGEIGKNAW